MTGLESPDDLTARQYQTEAIRAWMENQGQGILNMATGTGKTITALFAATRVASLQDGRIALVIAAPYRHLVDQWRTEVRNFGVEPFLAYQSRTQWIDDVAGAITEYVAGSRDQFVIITTHDTFATDHFQQLLGRLNGSETVFVADEVHHLGSPHLRESLPDHVRARLGLSATPERWYDEDGTNALYRYFSNGEVFEYGLAEAIDNGYLSEYYYVPHIVELTDDEAERYLALSKAIGRLLNDADASLENLDLQDDDQLQRLLFKRARLIGAAENKLDTLKSLLKRSGLEELHHTLVYCGDGQTPIEGSEDEFKRQIRSITELLGNELGIRAHQFTYEENQATRERLLDDFERGKLQALVAIRCLDEGVDVPATQTAFILASSTNPRQFVQRRGRILRPHEDKAYSIIHDFIVVPPRREVATATEDGVFSIERNLLKTELRRAASFTEHARNHPDASLSQIPTTAGSIRTLKEDFNLLDV